MASNRIIAEIRKKGIDGNYNTFFIGPEQRYSQALPTSNNNNLEEQLLMGVDRVIRSWHDDAEDVDRKTIEFRRPSDNKYYKLEIHQYKGSDNGDIFVKNESVHFISNMTVEGEDLIQSNYNENMSYSNGKLYVFPSGVVEKDDLKYVKANGDEIHISSKVITQGFENDAVVTKEVITNYLND